MGAVIRRSVHAPAAVTRAVRDPARLAALRSAGLLDTPPEESFDRLVRLSSQVLRAPIALVTLVDEERQFFKAGHGLPPPIAAARETPLSHSFCQHVVARRQPLVIPDARLDPVLRDNPLVDALDVIAYLGIPLVDSTGQALGTLCVIDHEPREWQPADVEILETFAASVLSEIELRRLRNAEFQQIVDHAPAIVFVKDLEGRFLLVNRLFETASGLDRTRVVGRHEGDLFPPELASEYRTHDLRVIETGEPLETDEFAELPDGRHEYVALRFPLVDGNDRPYAVAGISYDITQRRRTQRDLESSRATLAEILARITDGFVAFDREWRYTYVNERAGDLLGRRPDELIGRNYYEEFPEAVGTPFEQAYQRAMRDQVSITLDEYYEPWDRWFENRIYPSDDGLSIFFSEITERKRAERERQRLHDELERQSLELEIRVADRTADLEAANQELEAFAYTVSHDLRAPLRSMAGFGQALAEDHAEGLGEEGRDFAARIVAAASRMAELIDDLLEYARLTRAELQLSAVPLDDAVAEARAQLDAELRRSGASLDVESPLPAVTAHRRTVVQVIANLISNAAKFVPDDRQPEIAIRAETTGDRVRLWVEDNGIGIAADHVERIFRVFERLHGTESYPGTGIGLAIVRKGAEQMGGQAGVVSEPGSGSRFWVELAAAHPHARAA